MNLSDIIIYKNGKALYDLSNTIQYLQHRGRHKFGQHFYISPLDYKVIYQMIAWIVEDEVACEKFNISTKKGLLLTGPVGCGKTSLMKLFSSLSSKDKTFIIKPSREVTMEFSKYGYDVIHRYSRKRRSPKPICFDDIGIEPPMRYFGDEINVMGEILLSRYDLYISHGIRTHATTNLNAEEIEKRYGARVRSRLREMFNLIAFEAEAEDKRK